MTFSWPSPVSRSGMFLVALAAGWLIAGAAGIASAQSQSDTRQLMLFDAVRQNNLDQVHSIIQAGIDVARPDASGRTAVDLAVQNGHFGIAQHLILTRRLQQQSLTAAAPAPPIPGARADRSQRRHTPGSGGGSGSGPSASPRPSASPTPPSDSACVLAHVGAGRPRWQPRPSRNCCKRRTNSPGPPNKSPPRSSAANARYRRSNQSPEFRTRCATGITPRSRRRCWRGWVTPSRRNRARKTIPAS